MLAVRQSSTAELRFAAWPPDHQRSIIVYRLPSSAHAIHRGFLGQLANHALDRSGEPTAWPPPSDSPESDRQISAFHQPIMKPALNTIGSLSRSGRDGSSSINSTEPSRNSLLI